MSYRIPQSDANYGGDSAAHAGQRARRQAVPPKSPHKQPCLSSKRGRQWRFLLATRKLHSPRPGAAFYARQQDSSRTDRAIDSES
jgi:hypothetical protein